MTGRILDCVAFTTWNQGVGSTSIKLTTRANQAFMKYSQDPMCNLFRDVWRRLVPREQPSKQPVVLEAAEFSQFLRDAARKRLQQQRPDLHESPVGEALDRESCRNRLRHDHPNIDEAGVDEMIIDVDRVYGLIPGMCRRRVQQNRPNLDELDVEAVIMLTATPPPGVVANSLIQGIHLPREERIQEVAMMMVEKILSF